MLSNWTMRYQIHDKNGLIADATDEDEAYQIYNDIYKRRGDYSNFSWSGDLLLVKVIEVRN